MNAKQMAIFHFFYHWWTFRASFLYELLFIQYYSYVSVLHFSFIKLPSRDWIIFFLNVMQKHFWQLSLSLAQCHILGTAQMCIMQRSFKIFVIHEEQLSWSLKARICEFTLMDKMGCLILWFYDILHYYIHIVFCKWSIWKG